MQDTDKREFFEVMALTFEVYGKAAPSKAQVRVYWEVLKEYDMPAVSRAFSAWLGNPDEGKFIPKPGDIVRMINGSTGDAALLAWSKVDRALRSVGPYASVAFDDAIIHAVIDDMGGWIHLCGAETEDDLMFRGKEFEKRYRAYALAREVADYPRYLPGMVEQQNGSRGVEHDEGITLIGNADKAKEVLRLGKDGSEKYKQTEVRGKSIGDVIQGIGATMALPDQGD